MDAAVKGGEPCGFPGGFTVLMAVYARDEAGLFRRAVESVFANSLLPDRMLIVVDGPVPEELEGQLQSLTDRFPAILTVLRQPDNRGLAAALNLGLEHAQTEWVVRADADDINLPERFGVLACMVRTQPDLDLCSSDILEVDESGVAMAIRRVPRTQPEITRFLRQRSPFNHMSVAYRKAAVAEAGGYPALHLKEDYALWCSMIAKGAKVANSDQVLVHATTGRDMYSRRGGWKYAKGEIDLQRLMVSLRLKSAWRAYFDGILRAAVFLAPRGLRQWLYQSWLRQAPNKDEAK